MARSHRLREIRRVLHKHKITRGITPEKLREILEDLGPTYIKLGQIMSLHSDILPQSYCDELMKLQSDVTPMPFEELTSVISDSYGIPWTEVFSEIDENPLGSASIAQVHRAKLLTGEDVVVKVQRKGIYDVMSRDISMLHKLVKLMPPVSIKEMVDFDMVLNEMWMVAQEEMDFLKEASNMQEFARYNQEVRFVEVPQLYLEYTTRQILVMEYIDGIAIDDKETLQEEGYDLKEIGAKLVDNYIKQVMDDGFFHADPHPGNVKIRDGKIIWIDMGMMGRLSDRDRRYIEEAIDGFAYSDISRIQNAVLSLGQFKGEIDEALLYADIKKIFTKYGNMELGRIDVPSVMQDLMDVMKKNRIAMPHGMTMLVRGLTEMQGDLLQISPEINMVDIASARIKQKRWEEFNWKLGLKKGTKKVLRDSYKTAKIPGMISDALQDYLKGQSKLSLGLYATRDFAWLLRKLIRNLVTGIWVMALLISSSILCTTDMKPKILGIPAMGALGYLLAFVIVLAVVIQHVIQKRK
ncbi:MAG: lipopolysaccharide core heptose(II) kinase RfaY [Lachnospiraceae bacterium]|nr:lipopolysaccharide core heptose(II) kinase RfaY [Lachnospiraceae bacterium]